MGDARGEPPEGSGVPDWCGGKRKHMNAVGRSKRADSVPGRWAKSVMERSRGITRSSHSKSNKKDFCGGERERMAECSAIEALWLRRYQIPLVIKDDANIRGQRRLSC